MPKREAIIEAIKETAKANGGEPLGKRVFLKQTGIKESDWSGIYWARWSDALKEAGFTPNTYNQRTEQSVLLEKMIPAIRHFGKVPTAMENRIYKKTNPDVPNDKTIRNHFSTNSELIAALAVYVDGKSELEDIANLCKQLYVPQNDDTKPALNEGHVYLFKSGSHYKIGKTSNLERRVKEVTVALPESLTIVHTIRTDDADGIESYWHRRFNDRRANGEWFKLSSADVAAFKRRKFQ